jgi:hypothetical protein
LSPPPSIHVSPSLSSSSPYTCIHLYWLYVMYIYYIM